VNTWTRFPAGGGARGGNQMKIKRRFAVFIILLPKLMTPCLYSCTLISIHQEGQIWIGNNEDASPLYPTRAIFRRPEDEKFGYVIFGFADGWPQGGMNDQGLVVGWVAGYQTGWKSNPEKRDCSDTITLEILETCSKVDQALEIFRQCNSCDLQYAKSMVVDRTGKSVIVSGRKEGVSVQPSEGFFQVLGFGEEVVRNYLQSREGIVRKELADLLRLSFQKGNTPTLYSLIYNPIEGTIQVFNVLLNKPGLPLNPFSRKRAKSVITLRLNKELAMGSHYYDLPLLDSQIGRQLKKDITTLESSPVNPEIFAGFAGMWRTSSNYIIEIIRENGSLYMRHSVFPGRLIRLYPDSENSLFARCFSYRMEFIHAEENRASEMKIHWTRRTGEPRSEPAMRIPVEGG